MKWRYWLYGDYKSIVRFTSLSRPYLSLGTVQIQRTYRVLEKEELWDKVNKMKTVSFFDSKRFYPRNKNQTELRSQRSRHECRKQCWEFLSSSSWIIVRRWQQRKKEFALLQMPTPTSPMLEGLQIGSRQIWEGNVRSQSPLGIVGMLLGSKTANPRVMLSEYVWWSRPAKCLYTRHSCL